MWQNYLRVALRNVTRRKGYAFINVAGLTLGLAACLIIFQFVAFEYSFDRFHANERDLYRVSPALTRVDEPIAPGADTPYGMGPALVEGVPEVLRATRLHPEYEGAVVSSPARPERVFEEARAFFVDPAFLAMFSFPLVAGAPQTALAPGTILLTESAAARYFGDEDPLGQVLDWRGSVEGSYRVAGVLRDVPANSHLQFDFLLPVGDLIQSAAYPDPAASWLWNNFATYVQLRPGASRPDAERKMTEVYRVHLPEAFREMGLEAHVAVQPLRDIHLNAAIDGPDGNTVSGSYRTVYFFTVIGLVTLLIALVNYVNLATARALDRAREVGVRKAVGAARGQLVVQFLAESALTVFAAALLAVGLAAALTPLVNDLVETQLSGGLWLRPGFWAPFIGTLCAATLLAGVYPAVVLSSFRPAAALRGRVSASSGGLGLRRALVVLQFAASVVLVGGTAVVYDQLRYMRDLDLGLDLEQVLTVTGPRVLPEGADGAAATATLVEELRRLPAVRQVATSTSLPGQGFDWEGAQVRRAEDDPTSAIEGVAAWVDTAFVSLYGLELVAGDALAAFTPWPDSNEATATVIPNETAVRALGFDSPAAAVGEDIDLNGEAARIVGVFRDYNWTSAHTARESIFLGRTRVGDLVSLRLGTEDLPGTLAAVRAAYARLFPGDVFRYAFVDEAFDRQYRNDERFATLFTLFAGLAVAIACLGLFGLASFTARQRTKEIGVRKVLGASVGSLVALLTRDFLKLVALGVGVASPVVYYLMSRWLEGFAYHVAVGPGVLLLAGGVALSVALATVSAQALRAAQADPVRALRSE